MGPADSLPGVLDLIGGALRLDPQAFRAAEVLQAGPRMALFILFLGGLSTTLGQSVVLFANRVSRRRFVLNLGVSAAMLLVTVAFSAMSIWLAALLVFRAHKPFLDVLTIVSLSYAPLLFGFLVLLPYLGNKISHLLRIWILLATLVAVAAIYGFGFWEALFCTILGWLLLEVLSLFPVLNVDNLERLVWRLSTGTPTPKDTEEVVEDYLRETQSGLQPPEAGKDRQP